MAVSFHGRQWNSSPSHSACILSSVFASEYSSKLGHSDRAFHRCRSMAYIQGEIRDIEGSCRRVGSFHGRVLLLSSPHPL